MDRAHREVDRIISKAGREIKRIYADALARAKAVLKTAEADYRVQSQLLKGAELEAYRKQYFITSANAKARIKTLSNMLVQASKDANEVVKSYINESYIVGYNQTSKAVKRLYDITGERFSLLNETMLEYLMSKNPSIVPKTTVKVAKAEAWDTRRITREFRESVAKGESVNKMSRRLQKITGTDRNTALRHSRNMFTCAENRGRFNRHADNEKKFEKYGYRIRFQWLATNDDRTREHHRILNGTFANEEGYFQFGLRYAGDQDAPQEEWQNCRCTNIEVVEEIK